MYSQFETYTPDTAKTILEHRNKQNRPISRERVRRYAAEMRDGRWYQDTPEGVSFDRDGMVVDGQHTLLAVVESGATMRLYTHHDVPHEAQAFMNQGLARTAAQTLAMELGNAAGAARLSSAARAVLEHGIEVSKPSNSQIVAWARVPDHAAALARYAELGRLYTAGTHAAFVFAELSGLKGVPDAAKRLETLLWSGDDDPMRALANALKTMGGRDGAKAKKTKFFTALECLRAVNAGEGLARVTKREQMPRKVRESVRPELAA